MTREEIDRRLTERRAAFARRAPDALAAGHAPAGTFQSPAASVVHGREAILEVSLPVRRFPDFLLTWDSPIIEPPRAAVFLTFEGVAAGPFFGEVKAGTRPPHLRLLERPRRGGSPEGEARGLRSAGVLTTSATRLSR